MALLVLWVLLSAFIGGSDATWCACRSEVSSTALQKTLDYACGAGADCSAIHQNGACYEPNTVLAHCSYAANSYFQRNNQAVGSCDFSGTAMITTADPSYAGCSYPSTASAAGTGTTTTTTTTTTTPNAAPGSTTPALGTPTFAAGSGNGSVLGGLSPSGFGTTMSTDGTGAGLINAGRSSLSMAVVLPTLLLLRGW